MPQGRRGAASGDLTTAQAQARYLELRTGGANNRDAMAGAGRSLKTLDNWRRDDVFRAKADQASDLARADQSGSKDISFEEFADQYLGIKLFWHQLQWIDVLERREPRDLHPSQQYRKGDPTRVCINTPPFHAKTMTLSISWITYRLCLDPQLRVLIVSKTEGFAKKILGAIKTRLSHPQYRRLQADYGPQGGWEETSETWAKTQITFGGEGRDDVEQKDPTVEALGIGGHIYGSRADIIVLDDAVDRTNAHRWEDQLEWINTEVDSRIEEESGLCLVVGTRIKPEDLYVKLRDGDDPDEDPEDEDAEERPWTYLSQPAVLEFAERPEDWKTIWPVSSVPWAKGMPEVAPGLYDRWSGPRLAKKRRKSAKIWSLVYMQADVAEDSTFRPGAVKDAIDGMRRVGPMRPGVPGHRPTGMDGLYVIGSIDPSGSKDTALICYAIDRETKERWVLNAHVITPWTWPAVRKIVRTWSEDYDIDEWVVEKNMYHASLVHDEEIMSWLQARGVRVREHYTGNVKWDVDTGVAAMATLFGEFNDQGVRLTDSIIHLPSQTGNNYVRMLVEQLVTWQPSPPKTQKTDLVMALWFAEMRAREIASVRRQNRPTHLTNKFASARQIAGQGVVNIQDFRSRAS